MGRYYNVFVQKRRPLFAKFHSNKPYGKLRNSLTRRSRLVSEANQRRSARGYKKCSPWPLSFFYYLNQIITKMNEVPRTFLYLIFSLFILVRKVVRVMPRVAAVFDRLPLCHSSTALIMPRSVSANTKSYKPSVS